MKSNTQSSYHHGNLKDALIKEALNMVEKDGVQSITLRELTTKVGASRSAIYRHFSSKDELIKEVIKAALELLDSTTTPTMTNDDNVLEKFYNMGKAYLSFAMNHPNIYRMIFGNEVQEQREETCDINDEDLASGFHALVALLVEGQEKGVFKEEEPMLQATYVWANMHGLANLYIDGHISVVENIDALYEFSYETFLNGLKV